MSKSIVETISLISINYLINYLINVRSGENPKDHHPPKQTTKQCAFPKNDYRSKTSLIFLNVNVKTKPFFRGFPLNQ